MSPPSRLGRGMGLIARQREKRAAEAARQDDLRHARSLARLEAAERMLTTVAPVRELDLVDSWLIRRLAAATAWTNLDEMERILAEMLVRSPEEVRARMARLGREGWLRFWEDPNLSLSRTVSISAAGLAIIEASPGESASV